MDRKGWQLLAVTSPSPGCGKTFTAVNLALSICRLPERSALLVDLDLQRPRVADCLGIDSGDGVTEVLQGRAALPDVIT
jgi:Mrp family chromosome partitioning ATPase